MALVTVTAKKRFWHGGRDIGPGPVQMTAVDAAMHARAGRVSLSKVAHTYRTTALVADPPASAPACVEPDPVVEAQASPVEDAPVDAVPVVDPAPEPLAAPAADPSPAPADKKRRTYHRRDLTADPPA